MSLPIRYALQGPEILGPDGGAMVPGAGTVIRMSDGWAPSTAALTFGGAFAPIDDNSGPFIVGLDGPKPGLRYSAEFHCMVQSLANAPAEVRVVVQWRVTPASGVPGLWVDGAFVSAYDQASVTNVSWQALYRSPLTLGSALSSPVPAGALKLEARFAGLCNVGDAAVAGDTAFGRLVETL